MRLRPISMLLIGLLAMMPVYAQDDPPEEDAKPEAAAPSEEDAKPEAAAPSEEPKPKGPRSIRQVQISVWIVETNDQGLRDLGANLQYTRFDGDDESGGSLQQINTNLIDPRNPNFNVVVPEPNRELFPEGARPDLNDELPGLQTQQGGGLDFTIINTGHGTLDGIFRSNSRKSKITLVSRPEVLVIDGVEATIHAGGEVPFQGIRYDWDDDDGRGETKIKDRQQQLQVRWEKIGVEMSITPTIRPDGLIAIVLNKLNVSDVTRVDRIRGIDLPVFSNRSQTGWVVVPNGSTLVIGGLTSEVERYSSRRVPILGKLPLLGIPFRSRRNDKFVSHLLIFLSPTIVDLRSMTPKVERATDFYRDPDWKHTDEFERQKKDFE